MADETIQPLKHTRFEDMIDLSRVLHAVFQIAIIAVALISINMMQNPFDISAFSVLFLLALILILYYFFNKGYYRRAGSGLIVAISIIVTYNFIIAGGIHDNAMIIFPVLITISGLVLGRRFIPIMTGIILVEVTVIYLLTLSGWIEPYGGAIEVSFLSFLIVFILLVISGMVIWITVLTVEKNFMKLIDSENKLRESYNQTIDGWGKALELFDRDTEGHSLRVTELTLDLAGKLGLEGEDLEHIRRGALLHDIGKMGISEDILNKKESLTEKEKALVEKHPLHAYVLLKDIPFLEKAIDIPVYHHEHWDGTGYPYHLSSADIPLAARIFAIADNWDALTSDRPFRKAWPEDKVIQYIRNQSGKKFDPELVKLFLVNLSKIDPAPG
jgi:putative nucleotidyltransferase with HDIG domain